jgi:hypothetical protein
MHILCYIRTSLLKSWEVFTASMHVHLQVYSSLFDDYICWHATKASPLLQFTCGCEPRRWDSTSFLAGRRKIPLNPTPSSAPILSTSTPILRDEATRPVVGGHPYGRRPRFLVSSSPITIFPGRARIFLLSPRDRASKHTARSVTIDIGVYA